jgi:hypothetical protein
VHLHLHATGCVTKSLRIGKYKILIETVNWTRRTILSKVLAILFLAGILLKPCIVTGKQADKPLTNADIVSMVKAGLSESTIVLAIQLASKHGVTDFDTSPGALIELKKQGAAPKILDAMLEAQMAGRRYIPSTVVPGLPDQQGIYYKSNSGWLEVQSVSMWPEIKTKWEGWRGISAVEYARYVLAASRAPLQITTQRPTFYVRGAHPGWGWQLLKLVKKDDYRELTVSSDIFSFARKLQFERSEIQEIELNMIAPDVLTVRPASDLEPGEYLIVNVGPGQQWLLMGYEFGIASKQLGAHQAGR